MNALALGAKLAGERRGAGLTQSDLAVRMGSTQSAISRIESGRVLPTLEMIERYARALGRPLTLAFGSPDEKPSREDLRERVRRVLGDYVFDPWDRNPTESEARSLIGDGLTRHSFKRRKTSAAGGAVEFPESRIDGDEARTREVPVGGGAARVIGLDDLYFDRLRQATVDERREGVEFNSALAVVAARYDDLDWAYIRARLRDIASTEAPLAAAMKRIDSRIRRRVRRAIASD